MILEKQIWPFWPIPIVLVACLIGCAWSVWRAVRSGEGLGRRAIAAGLLFLMFGLPVILFFYVLSQATDL
jgi:hypothetical protein